MIKPIVQKMWPSSDGDQHPTLLLAQEREIQLLFKESPSLRDDSEATKAVMIAAAGAVIKNAGRVIAILSNRKPRKDRGKSRKKSIYQTTQEILDKAAADGIARANEKAKSKAPTGGITFGHGGVTKEQP